jgi:hypothetical protein
MLKPGDLRSLKYSENVLIVLQYSVCSKCALAMITTDNEVVIT